MVQDESLVIQKLSVCVSHSVVSDFFDTMDCSSPGSSVHEILQARILEWVVHFLLQGFFLTHGSNLGLPHCSQILYQQGSKPPCESQKVISAKHLRRIQMKFTCSALHGQTQPMSPSPYSWASVLLPHQVVACPLLFHCSNMLSGCTAFPTERKSVWESGTNITTNFTLSNSGQVQTTIVKNNSA